MLNYDLCEFSILYIYSAASIQTENSIPTKEAEQPKHKQIQLLREFLRAKSFCKTNKQIFGKLVYMFSVYSG